MERKHSMSRDQKSMIQQDDLAELKAAQIAGTIPMVKANLDESYEIPATEKDDFVHLFLQKKHYQAATNDFLYEDRIVPVRVTEFKRREAEGAYKGWAAKIIHDPTRKFKLTDVDHVDPQSASALESAQIAEERRRKEQRQKDIDLKNQADEIERKRKEQEDADQKAAIQKAADEAAAKKADEVADEEAAKAKAAEEAAKSTNATKETKGK